MIQTSTLKFRSLFLLASLYVPSLPAQDLIGHWQFDEGSGNTVQDASGNGNSGLLIGPTWTAGRFGTALSFDGADDYIQLTNRPVPSSGNQITYSAWIMPLSLGGQGIIKSSNANRGATLRFSASGGELEFYIGDGAAYHFFQYSHGMVPGNWYHVAARYDGTTAEVFVNGLSIGADVDAFVPVWGTTGANRFISDDLPDGFHGVIDEVRAYDRALTDQEIEDFFIAGSDSTPPTVPLGLQASALGQGVELLWTAAGDPESGISTYRIYRDTVSQTSKSFLAEVLGTQLAYTDSATQPGTVYFYEVAAVNGAGLEGPRSNEANALTGDDPPLPPTGLTAGAGDSIVFLDWNDSIEGDLAGYLVYRSEVSGGPYTSQTANPLTSSDYADTSVVNGLTYFYVVTALDSGNQESESSSEVNATPSDVDPSLIGHWKFDEGSGTTALDESGNGNTGTLINGTTWTTGKLGAALSFDGANDFVNLTERPVPSAGNEITYSVWIMPLSLGDQAIIKSSNAKRGSTLGFSAGGGELQFYIGDGKAYHFFQYPHGMVPGNWYHIAARYDGATAEVFVDGLSIGFTIDSFIPDWGTTGANRFISDDPPRSFHGAVDDVRVYSRGLSDLEILNLFSSGFDSTPPTAPLDLQAVPLGQRVDLLWTAADDPESGISMYHIYRDTVSGTSKNFLAEVSGAQLAYTDSTTDPGTDYFYEIAAVNGAGLEGSRSNEAGALTGDDPPAPPTGLTAAPGFAVVNLDWNDNVEGDLAGYLVYRSEVSGGPYISQTVIPLVSSDYEDTSVLNGVTYFYVVTALDSGNQESGISSETSATPSDVDPSLLAYWRFDEGEGTIAADSSGNGNTGTLIRAPSWVDGRTGKALEYDALLEQAVAVHDSPSLNPGTESFSIVFWIKFTNSIDSDIIRKGSTNSASDWYKVELISNTHRARFSLNTNQITDAFVESPESLADGLWHHIAAIRDRENGLLRLYVDAVELATATDPVGSVSNSADLAIGSKDLLNDDFFNGVLDDVRIYGRTISPEEIATLFSDALDSTPPSPPVNLLATANPNGIDLSWSAASDPESSISSYMIYRDTAGGTAKTLIATVPGEALTYTDGDVNAGITYYYQASAVNGDGLEGPRSNEASAVAQQISSLIGYWSFDEGTGVTAQDSSRTGNTGTLINGPTWTTGKIGSALSFDGVDDHVSLLERPIPSSGNRLTYSAWIMPLSLGGQGIIKSSNASRGATLRFSASGDELEFYVGDGAAYHFFQYPHGMIAGNWYHVVARYDGAVAEVFVNGVSIGATVDIFVPDWGTAGANRFISDDPPTSFHGVIDEVRVYSRDLTDSEIQDLFNAGGGP